MKLSSRDCLRGPAPSARPAAGHTQDFKSSSESDLTPNTEVFKKKKIESASNTLLNFILVSENFGGLHAFHHLTISLHRPLLFSISPLLMGRWRREGASPSSDILLVLQRPTTH
ncbi:hypothetical protein EVAR_72204_1 [Eumeta japonica]|uniref:Uncharacterized protein n=1 Tax=Eumeta variegata TaxID=151549 RepID=A0A4C1SJU0_EUMVA|nr:hypothetical protein EVAR_72204_1 [Eumeta japonica]